MATTVRLVTFRFFWLMLCALYVPLETKDHDCGSSLVYVNVTSSGGVLYSPGYPEEYPNSVTCTWLLTSKQRGKVLQLRPLDLQLGPQSRHDGACSGDVVTAYDGRTTSSSLLHVWCGEDVQVVYSSGASVLVTFVADRHRRHRGFAIHYSLLTLSDNSCERDTVRTLPLQNNNPIVVDFSSLPTLSLLTSTCSWRLVADDMGSQVVVDLERFDNGLPCEDGNFSVYDGPETTSPEVVRWCARNTKPFTSVYMSGGQGMVVLRTRPNVTAVLRFRFYTRPKVFPRCSRSSPSHMPTVELKGEDPVYINFPLAVNDRGASCPVHVLSATASTLWARVDILRTPQGLPACPTSPASSSVTVLQANETEGENAAPTVVHPTCFRENRPVFWPIAESVIVSPAADSRGLLLKITPAERGACHGRLLHVTAPTDEVFVIKNPRASLRTLQYSRSMWCRYVVSGKNEGDHVLVNMDAELCELKDSCGDFIRLYDGPSTDSPLLYDSANRTHVTLHVISTGRHVTFEFATDDRDNRGFIKAEFNSVPGPNLCSEIQEVKASRLPQNLSSFNFPHYYPVNYMCQYCIVSDNPDDVIHIHVIESDMMYSCSDVVEVYEGDSDHKAPEFLGRFCSHDKPHYVSKGPGLCLLFRSDPSGHGKGWLLSYHAAPPASSLGHPQHDSGSMSSGSSPATTATAVVALVVLIAVIVVFIVYIVKNKRRERRSLG